MGNRIARVPVYVWPPVAIVGVVLVLAILGRVAVPATHTPVSNKLAAQLVEGAKQKLEAAKQGVLSKKQFESAVEGLAQLDAAAHLVPSAALERATRTNIDELRTKLTEQRDASVSTL